MTTMSNLPRDLIQEILSRVPLTSLQTIRSICKKWDALSRTKTCGKTKAGKGDFLGFMMMDSKVCSLRFDLQEDVTKPSIKQVSLLNKIEVSELFHADGLLLCVMSDRSSLLVWNPYLGQTRLIQPRTNFHRLDRYALGYDYNKKNYKILRFLDIHWYDRFVGYHQLFEYEIYDSSSNSWRVLDVTADWNIECFQRGVSIKGNTFFFSHERDQGKEVEDIQDFLLCFDFTTERFGPHLPLPFHSYLLETVSLSCARDEQLSILYQRLEFIETMEVWVTTKIEHSDVSWSMFLKVEMNPLIGFQFYYQAASFFIDEEKKIVVVFSLDIFTWAKTPRSQMAYVIGQDGYFNPVNIGEAPNLGKPDVRGVTTAIYCEPLVSTSYAPSLVRVQLDQPERKRKERSY